MWASINEILVHHHDPGSLFIAVCLIVLFFAGFATVIGMVIYELITGRRF